MTLEQRPSKLFGSARWAWRSLCAGHFGHNRLLNQPIAFGLQIRFAALERERGGSDGPVKYSNPLTRHELSARKLHGRLIIEPSY